MTEKTHSIKELFEKTEGLPNDFISQLDVLRCDGDGGDFRYITDKEDNPYFKDDVLYIMNPLEFFLNFVDTDILIQQKENKKLKELLDEFLQTHYNGSFSQMACEYIRVTQMTDEAVKAFIDMLEYTMRKD